MKRGLLPGTETKLSSECRAAVGQRGDPGIRGTGTMRAVSLA